MKLNNNGQALIEYVLMVSFIAIIGIALMNYLGGFLKDSITKAGCDLTNKEYIEGSKPGEAKCEYKETILN